jgi:hypothetical protein
VITLYAAVDVAAGRVWGIGTCEYRAALDAAEQMDGHRSSPPPLEFFVVTVAEARAIAGGSVHWPRRLPTLTRGAPAAPGPPEGQLPTYRPSWLGFAPASCGPMTLPQVLERCGEHGVDAELYDERGELVGHARANGDWRMGS